MTPNFPHRQHVFGWLDLEAAFFTCAYAAEFLGEGLVFNSLEIGVHHGKYFLVLEQLTPPDGDCWAVDVFSRQDLNVDTQVTAINRFLCSIFLILARILSV